MKFFFAAALLLSTTPLWARPAGPLTYRGPDRVGNAGGIEARQRTTKFKYDDDEQKVTHSINEFSALMFRNFNQPIWGFWLAAANAGEFQFKDDATAPKLKDGIGLGLGSYFKFTYDLSDAIRTCLKNS